MSVGPVVSCDRALVSRGERLDASVVAQAAVVPHLSQRRSIFVLDARAPDADYVIAASMLSPWPAANFDELQTLLEERRTRGYTVVFEGNGWTVLHANAKKVGVISRACSHSALQTERPVRDT